MIDDAAAAASVAGPGAGPAARRAGEPASASTLAAKLGLPRQRINYHLKALERHGLVELVEERRRGTCIERVTAGERGAVRDLARRARRGSSPDPAQSPDRLSARWLLALAARLVRDVGELMAGANRAGPRARDVRARRRGALRLCGRPRGVRRGAGWAR